MAVQNMSTTASIEKVQGGANNIDTTPSSAPVPTDSDHGSTIVYLQGIRFMMLAALIGIMVFLVSVEANIAVTSLVAISHDLGGFEIVTWILSSYQLGFVSLIVISAKLSDMFGRKPITVILILIFTVFSAGCAAAQSMTQLIVLRAFQGVGGGGCYTLAAILIVDSAPPEKYGKYVANAGISIAMGTVLGPVIGGAISENTTWRWIFWFNVPVGAFAIFLAVVGMPNSFPYNVQEHQRRFVEVAVFKKAQKKLDLPGSFLLVCAVLSFTACFMEAGLQFSWDSAYVITLLIASVGLWVAVLLWERRISRANQAREPVLPWQFFTNRVMVSVILGMALVGAPMTVTTFQLPQRFQLVNGLSSLDAGLRLLPFGAMFPIGSMVATTVASKFKIPAIYLVFLGSVLQVVGYALLSTLTTSVQVESAVYGYLIMCGFGCGMTFTMLYITVPFTVDKCDKAVGMAAANQFRTMGSAMGLAIATSIFNDYLAARFSGIAIIDVVDGKQMFPEAFQEEARIVLSEAYNRQMLVLCAFSSAQILTTLLMWRKDQVITA